MPIATLNIKDSLTPSQDMATHSSVLAWRIPEMEEPGGYHTQPVWGHTESDMPKVT